MDPGGEDFSQQPQKSPLVMNFDEASPAIGSGKDAQRATWLGSGLVTRAGSLLLVPQPAKLGVDGSRA